MATEAYARVVGGKPGGLLARHVVLVETAFRSIVCAGADVVVDGRPAEETGVAEGAAGSIPTVRRLAWRTHALGGVKAATPAAAAAAAAALTACTGVAPVPAVLRKQTEQICGTSVYTSRSPRCDSPPTRPALPWPRLPKDRGAA